MTTAKDAPLILALDQGTTSSRAILFSDSGEIVAVRQKDLAIETPESGWVQQDAMAIWLDTLDCARDVLRQAGGGKVCGIGITNQRETTVLWDRETGKPIHPAIVWQDRRTAPICAALKEAGHEETVRGKTGLIIDPYFSATKIGWILDRVEGARARAEKGEILFGTVESWLLWNLTGGRVHASDVTNASRTMLLDSQKMAWDDDLLGLFNVPRAMLPEIVPNCADFGAVEAGLLPQDLHVLGMAGDQQAAMVGQACFKPGMVKSTYGTGCFALMHIGETFRLSDNRLLTTPAYRIGGETAYALEGAIFVAGAAIQWLRDGLGLIAHAKESEALAQSVADTGGVYFVPALTGLGAPYWQPDSRGLICGISRGTTKAHIARAALEAQAYQTRDLVDCFEKDSGEKLTLLRADGGLTHNRFMCQFLADQLDVPIDLPEITESTALGAAYLAGLQAGIYTGLDDIAARRKSATLYTPSAEQAAAEATYTGWKNAVAMLVR